MTYGGSPVAGAPIAGQRLNEPAAPVPAGQVTITSSTTFTAAGSAPTVPAEGQVTLSSSTTLDATAAVLAEGRVTLGSSTTFSAAGSAAGPLELRDLCVTTRPIEAEWSSSPIVAEWTSMPIVDCTPELT